MRVGSAAEPLLGQELPRWASCHTSLTHSQFGLFPSPGSSSAWARIKSDIPLCSHRIQSASVNRRPVNGTSCPVETHGFSASLLFLTALMCLFWAPEMSVLVCHLLTFKVIVSWASDLSGHRRVLDSGGFSTVLACVRFCPFLRNPALLCPRQAWLSLSFPLSQHPAE